MTDAPFSRDAAVRRTRGWAWVAFFASGVSAYALAVLALRDFGPPFIHERLAAMPSAVIGHILGGAVALFTGAAQVNARWRARFLHLHRWTGRVYVVAVAVGGAAGLVLATRSQGGLVTHAGFGLLAVLWLITTAMAYRRIRLGDQAAHRRWMLRSYALTFAAVTLRIYLPASVAAGVPFLDAYQVIAWACWVPNLIVTEWFFVTAETGVHPHAPTSGVVDRGRTTHAG